MYIEAVVICVDYSDFLAHTLPANRSLFDNMVVVTNKKDKATVRICNKYNVRCIETDVFYENGKGFNKGAAINAGLQCLSRNGWVVQMDADIYMPPLTRHILERLTLDQRKMYGVDRLMCRSYDEWMKYREGWSCVHESWTFAHLDVFPVGSRIVQYGDFLEDGKPDGWVPIGFFQLWHPGTSGKFNYPSEHGAADRSDVLHAKQFPRKMRELIPEIVVVHLDSEPAPMGENWNGRKTARFGYIPLELRKQKEETERRLLNRMRALRLRLASWLRETFNPPFYGS